MEQRADARAERPVEQPPAGRSLVLTDDPYHLATVRLRELGCVDDGRGYWTCPRCHKAKKLHVSRHSTQPGGVPAVHCFVCDDGRAKGELSVVSETLGLGRRDLSPNRDVTVRCSHVPDVPGPSPSPSVIAERQDSDDDEIAELRLLIEASRAGQAKAEPVSLGDLPSWATPDMRRAAAIVEWLIGLRLRASEDRPLPLATRFLAELAGWPDHRRASRALRGLERAEWLRHVGDMPVRKRPDGKKWPRGTKLYEPGGTSLMALLAEASEIARPDGIEPFEGAQFIEERVGLDPTVEVREQPPVERAQPPPVPPRRSVRVVASENGAAQRLRSLGHETDDNGVIHGLRLPARWESFGKADPEADWVVAAFAREFDAVEIHPGAVLDPTARRPLAIDCKYASHAGREWRLHGGGPWRCGTCHPPAAGLAVVWRARARAAPLRPVDRGGGRA